MNVYPTISSIHVYNIAIYNTQLCRSPEDTTHQTSALPYKEVQFYTLQQGCINHGITRL